MKYIFPLLFLLPLIQHAQVNWDEQIIVNTSADYENLHPRIQLDGENNPVIIWGSTSVAGVYFSRWDGLGFTLPMKINPDDMEIFTASWAGPDLASYGDTLYIVVKENPEATAPVYLFASYDGGVSFSAPVIVDGMIGEDISRFPAVTVNGEGQPIVAFMKLDSDFSNPRYVVSTSDDYGMSFEMDLLASDFSGGEVCDCCPVSVVAENNYVATLYRDNLDNLRNSWAGISNNGGDMFVSGIQIDQTNWTIMACPASGPDGVIIGDSLYSVFMSAADGDTKCFFSASSLLTLEDGMDLPLTDFFPEASTQNYPRAASYNNAVAMVWKQISDDNSQAPILFTENILERSWVIDTVAHIDFYGIENADVVLSADAIHVVWQDNHFDAVYYRKGTYGTPVKTNDIFNQQIKVYPNPAGDIVYVDEYGGSKTISLEFSEITGCKLQVEYEIFENKISVNTASLPAGMYFLNIQDDKLNYTVKLLIQ
jgi:hypothetical protein